MRTPLGRMAAAAVGSRPFKTIRGIGEVQSFLISRPELESWLESWLTWHRKIDDRDDVDGESRLRCVDLLTVQEDPASGAVRAMLGAGTELRKAVRCASRDDPSVEEHSMRFAGRTLRVHVTNMFFGAVSPELIVEHIEESREVIKAWDSDTAREWIDIDSPLFECFAGKQSFKILGRRAEAVLQFAFNEPSLSRLGLDTNYPAYHSVYYWARSKPPPEWTKRIPAPSESWR